MKTKCTKAVWLQVRQKTEEITTSHQRHDGESLPVGDKIIKCWLRRWSKQWLDVGSLKTRIVFCPQSKSGLCHSQYHCLLFQDIPWSKTTAAGWGFPLASGMANTWNETQISYSLCLSRSLVGFWRPILMVLAQLCQQMIFNTVSLNLNFHFDTFCANVCHIIISIEWKGFWRNV